MTDDIFTKGFVAGGILTLITILFITFIFDIIDGPNEKYYLIETEKTTLGVVAQTCEVYPNGNTNFLVCERNKETVFSGEFLTFEEIK